MATFWQHAFPSKSSLLSRSAFHASNPNISTSLKQYGPTRVCSSLGKGGDLRALEFRLGENFKEKIAKYYDARSAEYDMGPKHLEIAKTLVDGCNLKRGDKVLDLCTGTGIVALLAAEHVQKDGRVVGVDLAPLMLEKLREKLVNSEYESIVEVVLGDAENVTFPPETFDWVLCASAFVWMSDMTAALARWRTFLVPGGGIAFHAFPREAFVAGVEMIEAAAKNGVKLTFSQPTGDELLVENMLVQAGFSSIQINRETSGNYMTIEKTEEVFDSMMGPSGPIEGLSVEHVESIRKDFIDGIKKRASDEGVWNDTTTLYTYARKES